MFGAIVLLLLGGGSLFFSIWLTPYTNEATTLYLVGFYIVSAVFLLWGLWRLVDEMGWFIPAQRPATSAKKNPTVKPISTEENTPKVVKAATVKTKQPLTKDLWKNCSYNMICSILLVVILPIYAMLFSWVLSWFMEPKTVMDHVHWIPLVLTGIAFFFTGAVIYSPDNNSPIFQNYDPSLKTFAEVDAFLKKRLQNTNYNAQRRMIFFVSLPCYIGVLALCCLFSDYCLNFLFVSPIFLLAIFVATDDNIADSYITAKIDDQWRENVCPHCGAIYSKFRMADRTYDRSEFQNLGKTTTTVTDKYTNGVDTIYVDHDETSYFVDSHSSYTEEYICERCGQKKTKRVRHSSREYL